MRLEIIEKKVDDLNLIDCNFSDLSGMIEYYSDENSVMDINISGITDSFIKKLIHSLKNECTTKERNILLNLSNEQVRNIIITNLLTPSNTPILVTPKYVTELYCSYRVDIMDRIVDKCICMIIFNNIDSDIEFNNNDIDHIYINLTNHITQLLPLFFSTIIAKYISGRMECILRYKDIEYKSKRVIEGMEYYTVLVYYMHMKYIKYKYRDHKGMKLIFSGVNYYRAETKNFERKEEKKCVKFSEKTLDLFVAKVKNISMHSRGKSFYTIIEQWNTFLLEYISSTLNIDYAKILQLENIITNKIRLLTNTRYKNTFIKEMYYLPVEYGGLGMISNRSVELRDCTNTNNKSSEVLVNEIVISYDFNRNISFEHIHHRCNKQPRLHPQRIDRSIVNKNRYNCVKSNIKIELNSDIIQIEERHTLKRIIKSNCNININTANKHFYKKQRSTGLNSHTNKKYLTYWIPAIVHSGNLVRHNKLFKQIVKRIFFGGLLERIRGEVHYLLDDITVDVDFIIADKTTKLNDNDYRYLELYNLSTNIFNLEVEEIDSIKTMIGRVSKMFK